MQEASLLVLAGRCNAVPRSMQQAAVQSGLMTDGRLVVDAAFRTNDPHIFAAGTIAKFSRRSAECCLASRFAACPCALHTVQQPRSNTVLLLTP